MLSVASYHSQKPSTSIEPRQLPKRNITPLSISSSLLTQKHPLTKKKHPKTVRFSTELCKVRTFDKTLCPLSINGLAPLIILSPVLEHIQHRVYNQKICLSEIKLDSYDNQITGKVRVINLGFQKRVSVRYSYDNWQSFEDSEAHFFRSAKNLKGNIDIFSYSIPIPKDISKACNKDEKLVLKFAIQYNVNGQYYWDSNEGSNYSAEIQPSNQQSLSTLDSIVYLPEMIIKSPAKIAKPIIAPSTPNNPVAALSSQSPTLSGTPVSSQASSSFMRRTFDDSLKANGVVRFGKPISKSKPITSFNLSSNSLVNTKLLCCSVDYSQRFGWGS